MIACPKCGNEMGTVFQINWEDRIFRIVNVCSDCGHIIKQMEVRQVRP